MYVKFSLDHLNDGSFTVITNHIDTEFTQKRDTTEQFG